MTERITVLLHLFRFVNSCNCLPLALDAILSVSVSASSLTLGILSCSLTLILSFCSFSSLLKLHVCFVSFPSHSISLSQADFYLPEPASAILKCGASLVHVFTSIIHDCNFYSMCQDTPPCNHAFLPRQLPLPFTEREAQTSLVSSSAQAPCECAQAAISTASYCFLKPQSRDSMHFDKSYLERYQATPFILTLR